MALEFEEILPYVEGEGDTGKTAREKINRNFTKIEPLANVGAEMQQLRQDVSDDLEQLHDDVEEMVDKTTSLFGYYSCSTAGATAAKTVQATNYELTNGGNIRIKMEHANTAASPVTLQIGNAAAKDLYYNNEAVSDENTWEDNEVIIVYYDGEKYLATNSLGGGLKDIQKNIDDIEDELFQKSELVPSSSIYASTDLFDGSVFTFYGFTISTQLQLKEIRTITATQRGASDCIILFVADKETGTIKSKHRIEFDSTEIRTIDVSNLNIVLGEGDTFAYASGVSPINTQSGICNTVIRRLADVDGGITYYARRNAGDSNLDVGGVLPNVGWQYIRQFTGYPPFEMYFEGESLSEKVDALSDAVNANEQNISELADEVGAKETVIPYGNENRFGTRLKVFEFFGLNISENQQVKRIVTPTSVTGSFILFTLNEDTTLIKTKNVIVFDNATEVDVSNLDIILEAGDTIAYSTTAETENSNDFFQSIWLNDNGYSVHILDVPNREKSIGETMGRNPKWVKTGYPLFSLVMESSSLGEKVTELERQVRQNTAAIEMGGSAATANKTLAVLGDSITWFQISSEPLRGWLTYFKEQILFKGVRNYALSGATWTNTANTQDSDLTTMNSSSDNNVIYNQVRRLIADVNNGSDTPDYIMILAGINDAYERGQNALYDDFSASDWGSVGGTTRYIGSRAITTCTSIYKAMRYVAEMIWEEFPFAQVIVTTPLRSKLHTSERKTVSELIKKSAYEFGWTCIDQDEVNVSILKETLVTSEGRMLASDGLHPTVEGAKIIGRWLASKFKANMA